MKSQSRQTSPIFRLRPGRCSDCSFSSYWVCEKSDGIRVLLFVATLGDAQSVFLVCAAGLFDDNQPLIADGFHLGLMCASWTGTTTTTSSKGSTSLTSKTLGFP